MLAVTLMVVCAMGAMIAFGSEDSDATTFGSETDPLTALDTTADAAIGETYYVAVGSSVTISCSGNWVCSDVTSGYGISQSGAKYAGTVSKAGTITVEFWIPDGEEYGSVTIIAVEGPSTVSIDSVGGTEATVGYRYAYSVQTTPSDAEVSISGVDWLSVSGHAISGTPTTAGSYTLEITASKDGYASATEKVVIVVSEAPVTQDAPVITDFGYTVSTGNAYRITFSVTAVDASSISIDYGDGTSGTGPSSTHTYSRSGSYTVRATASNAAGSVTSTLIILVADSAPGTSVQYNHEYAFTLGMDTEGVTPSVTGCPFLSVTTGSNYVKVSGTPSSTSYVGKTYDVTLTAGSYTLSWKLTVTEGSTVPTAGFSFETDGLTVTVTSTASNADVTFYRWTEGGSFVQSNTGTTKYTYSGPGTYTVTQRVTATIDGQTVTDEFSATVTVTDAGEGSEPAQDEDRTVLYLCLAMVIVGVLIMVISLWAGMYPIAGIAALVAAIGGMLLIGASFWLMP
ncbi:PKD domain-containing protein [Candidatus Methanoprimaticola sp. MG2]|uniref:PKD domain-containing protein n=1 Tax=Candidatus Methanoprimaticola sp. MG2 TaxID=3228838 RepID=UPI0039C69B24